MKTDVLKEFEELGRRSSFYLADDTSSGEWRTGYGLQRQAIALYREHRELQEQMRVIAREHFIWRLPDED